MTRLRNHSTMPLYESNQNEHNLLISYLNVRSYEAKLPDLILDPILQSSDIICLTETWLAPHKPFKFFKPNNITFRCDRSILNVQVTYKREVAGPKMATRSNDFEKL